MTLKLIKVTRVRDAIGAYCLDCQRVIADDCNPYWHWHKSQVLHEKGTGHRVIMVKYIEVPEPDRNQIEQRLTAAKLAMGIGA